MRSLPTIGQVMALVRQEEVAQTKQASASNVPAYASEIAKGLHEIAGIVKAAGDVPVTYEDVLGFGRNLVRGGQA